jgi:hypothetical protein
MRLTYERAIAQFDAASPSSAERSNVGTRGGSVIPAAPFVERRSETNAQCNPGRRSSDVALVTHGDVAFLTFEGFLDTAAHLADIILFLAARESANAACGAERARIGEALRS